MESNPACSRSRTRLTLSRTSWQRHSGEIPKLTPAKSMLPSPRISLPAVKPYTTDSPICQTGRAGPRIGGQPLGGVKVTGMEAQPSRLGQARNWYFENVDALPADGWTKSTLCEGWTASHLVAHVATGDQLFLAMLFDALGKDRTGLDLPTDFADRRQRFEAMATWEPARLKETARKASEETVAAIGDAAREAPDTIVNVPFGKVPIPVVRGLRLNEYIIHGHDLTPAIGRPIPIPDWFIERAGFQGRSASQRAAVCAVLQTRSRVSRQPCR